MEELDRASLMRLLEHLSYGDASPGAGIRDVAAAQRTCRVLAALGRAPCVWRGPLARDFGLELDGPGVAALDLQTVYARLAAAGAPSALRFLAAYTNGGTDGGDEELHYWADHCFTPNHWAPHCSDAPLDISIVGVLKGTPHGPDMSRSAHRAYLIQRSKYAAAILFAPPGGGAALLADPEPAARMLRTWSMAGLERLFADLFQDLFQNAGSTWGKHLLRGVPPEGRAAEFARLRAAFDRVLERASLGAYRVQRLDSAWVRQVHEDATVRAAAFAASPAARLHLSSCSTSPATVPTTALPCSAERDAGASPGASWSAEPPAGQGLLAGGTAVPAGPLPGLASGPTGSGFAQQAHAAAAPPPPPEPAAQAGAAGGAAPAPGSQAAAVAGAGQPPLPGAQHGLAVSTAPDAPQPWLARSMAPAAVAARHQADAAVLAHMSASSGGRYGRETAVVCEVVVSRAGHFTCPCLAGAVLLGQAPATPAAAAGPRGSAPHVLSGQLSDHPRAATGAGAGTGTAPHWTDHAASAARLVAMPSDPMCAALARCTSATAVRAAVAAGDLPPLLAYTAEAGAEWIEFAPLPRAARAARRAAGWASDPVAWFRFAPRGELAPHQVQAGAAALQVLAPGDEGDVLMVDGEEDEGAAEAEGEGAGGEGGAGAGSEAGSDNAAALVPMAVGAGVAGGSDAAYTDALSSGDEGEGGEAYDTVSSSDAGEPAGTGPGPSHVAAGGLSLDAASGSAPMQQQPTQSQAQAQPQQSQHQEQARPPSPPKRQRGCTGRASGNAATPAAQAGAVAATPSAAALGRGVSLDRAPGFFVLPAPDLGELPHRGPPALVLRMPLRARRSGNTAIVRLINQENLMALYSDEHDVPNIDLQYAALRGWAVTLPPGVDAL